MWEVIAVMLGVVVLWALGAAFGWLMRESMTELGPRPQLPVEAPPPEALAAPSEVDEVLASFARKPFRLAVWWNDLPPSGYASEYRN